MKICQNLQGVVKTNRKNDKSKNSKALLVKPFKNAAYKNTQYFTIISQS